MVRETSIHTYNDLIQSGAINKMQQRVMLAFLRNPSSTDLEVAEKHELKINVVTARRNELVSQGVMMDVGKRKCRISTRLAHVWRVRTIEEIRKGNPNKKEFLTATDMKKLQKNILLANDFQKIKVRQWCEEQ